MNGTSDTNRSVPNNALAERIVAALYSAGLIRDNYEESVLSKLSNGKARESDWRLWAEDVVLAKERTDGDESKD